MKTVALILSLISLVLLVIFIRLATKINKQKKLPELDREGKNNFYATVTALAVIGISIGVCSAISCVILLN